MKNDTTTTTITTTSYYTNDSLLHSFASVGGSAFTAYRGRKPGVPTDSVNRRTASQRVQDASSRECQKDDSCDMMTTASLLSGLDLKGTCCWRDKGRYVHDWAVSEGETKYERKKSTETLFCQEHLTERYPSQYTR